MSPRPATIGPARVLRAPAAVLRRSRRHGVHGPAGEEGRRCPRGPGNCERSGAAPRPAQCYSILRAGLPGPALAAADTRAPTASAILEAQSTRIRWAWLASKPRPCTVRLPWTHHTLLISPRRRKRVPGARTRCWRLARAGEGELKAGAMVEKEEAGGGGGGGCSHPYPGVACMPVIATLSRKVS